MTYQEKFEQLRKQFGEKSDKYLKAEQELSSIQGFGDIASVPNFADAKQKFEDAGNQYHSFLTLVKDRGASPNDIYS